MVVIPPYPIIDMRKTGENIQRLREKCGLAVSDVQKYLGLANPQAIYHWQRGTSLPTVDHLCALSHLFDVPMNEILVLVRNPEDSAAEIAHTSRRTQTKLFFWCIAA